MTNRDELAKLVEEVTLIEEQMKKLKENTEKRSANFRYSYLISRSSMLRDYFDRARKLHAEILAGAPADAKGKWPYFKDSVFTKVETQFDERDSYLYYKFTAHYL